MSPEHHLTPSLSPTSWRRGGSCASVGKRNPGLAVHPTMGGTAAEDGRSPVKKSPRESSKRLAREWRTIETMVRIYCRDNHEGGLCPECKGLLDYASVRLDRCRFGADKPTCAKCPVHCYQKNRREQVKAVMRYAGPRMLWEHPILSLWHWVDGMRRREG